jgi:hypothetical protein
MTVCRFFTLHPKSCVESVHDFRRHIVLALSLKVAESIRSRFNY